MAELTPLQLEIESMSMKELLEIHLRYLSFVSQLDMFADPYNTYEGRLLKMYGNELRTRRKADADLY